MQFEDRENLSIVLEQLLKQYSVKDIVQALSDLCVTNASKMIDYELPSAAKEWSEMSFIISEIVDQMKK